MEYVGEGYEILRESDSWDDSLGVNGNQDSREKEKWIRGEGGDAVTLGL